RRAGGGDEGTAADRRGGEERGDAEDEEDVRGRATGAEPRWRWRRIGGGSGSRNGDRERGGGRAAGGRGKVDGSRFDVDDDRGDVVVPRTFVGEGDEPPHGTLRCGFVREDCGDGVVVERAVEAVAAQEIAVAHLDLARGGEDGHARP